MEKITKANQFLNKKQVAELLNVSVNTISAWVSQKRIPYIKLAGGNRVRFELDEINKWIAEGKIKPIDFDSS